MIELEQYQIDSDGMQYVIKEKKRYPADHPKRPNVMYLGQARFYSTFAQCMNAVMNNEMMRLTSMNMSSLTAINQLLENFGSKVQEQVVNALVNQRKE